MILRGCLITVSDSTRCASVAWISRTNNAYGKEWLRLTPDSTGKYETGSWSSEIDMINTREYFASGVLRDGRVYAIGGEDSDAGSDTPLGEIFDPQANGGVGAWSAINKPTPSFDFVRGDCNGSGLADGRVLLGGATTSGAPSSWSKRTAIWDPSDNSWVEAGLQFGALSSTDKEDPFEEETWALLPDGSVLAPAVRDTPGAQRYVPSLDQWVNCKPSPVNLAIITIQGTDVYETGGLIVLPNGSAYAIGGTGQTAIFTPGPTPTDPGSWAQGPSFPADNSVGALWPTLTALDSPACLLPSGKVVTMGGTTALDVGLYYSRNPVFLEYDPTSSATTLPPLDAQPSLPVGNYTWQYYFLLLPTGQLMCSTRSNSLLIYTPDPASGSPDPSWKPANISVPAHMAQGHSYTLSGTQINGLSQAVSYGDDGGMATNYPIVRVTNTASGQVVYLRSYNFSTMGVATGTTVPNDLESCTIDIPSNLAAGDWNLVVIANGIASDPIPVQIGASGGPEPVARTPEHMDVFWVGQVGSVGTNWWDANANNGQWNTPFEIAPAASAQGVVNVVARTPEHMDVFWVGQDGSVGTNWWDANANNGQWNTPFDIAPAGSAQG
jgi:hypothetical protein